MRRGRRAFYNTLMGMAEEGTAILCGFILPRLILSVFGSDYNGLTASITQFLSYAILFRAGIGGAVRAALYRPLCEDDKEKVDGIIRAADLYLRRVGLILAAAIVAMAAAFAFFVSSEFDWFFTFSLFLIIGGSTFAQTFFGITYQMLLQADQKKWVTSLISCVSYLLNTVVSVLLIQRGCSIHVVKLGSSLVYVLAPIIQRDYVIRHYRINKKAEPDFSAISQRWDAFWHQIADFVMNNTDILILTIFSSMAEVSVYSVYNMILNGLKRAVLTITDALEAPFGDMIAKNEMETLRRNLEAAELILYSICTALYTTAGLLIFSFVRIYTRGISDVSYIRPAFAYLYLLACFFFGIRAPYQSVVQAAGHYRQTKRASMIEPVLNLLLSVVFVLRYGLAGVAVGTLAATIYRTVLYSVYVCKNIVVRSPLLVLLRILLSFLEAGLIVFAVSLLRLPEAVTYGAWVIRGLQTACIASGIVLAGDFLFYRKALFYCSGRLLAILKI